MSRDLVLGAGISGQAATRLLCERETPPVVYDRDPDALLGLVDSDCQTISGEWQTSNLEGIERVIASPGFAETSMPITDTLAANIPLISELELAFGFLEAPLIAVTGTNGKTTVTELISQMLTASGIFAPPSGNFGTPLSAQLLDHHPEVAVVECSSFQLAYIDRFEPGVAVITNVAVDHLDWHSSYQSYLEAKTRILENQTERAYVIFPDADPVVVKMAEAADAQPIAVPSNLDKWTEPDQIPAQLSTDPIAITNIGLAMEAATLLGTDLDRSLQIAWDYQPPPHRRQLLGEIAGVFFIDDSKATNPHAALASIEAASRRFRSSVLLIAGGLSKGLDLSPLLSHPSVTKVFAIGDSAPELYRLAPELVIICADLTAAVRTAYRHAHPGEVVLLAPGGASFDAYRSYQERGQDFSAAVASLSEQGVSQSQEFSAPPRAANVDPISKPMPPSGNNITYLYPNTNFPDRKPDSVIDPPSAVSELRALSIARHHHPTNLGNRILNSKDPRSVVTQLSPANFSILSEDSFS